MTESPHTSIYCPNCGYEIVIYYPNSNVTIFCIECGTKAYFYYNGKGGYNPVPRWQKPTQAEQLKTLWMREMMGLPDKLADGTTITEDGVLVK